MPKPGKAEVARGVADVGDRKIAECRHVEVEHSKARRGRGWTAAAELASTTAEVPASKKGSPFHRDVAPEVVMLKWLPREP